MKKMTITTVAVAALLALIPVVYSTAKARTESRRTRKRHQRMERRRKRARWAQKIVSEKEELLQKKRALLVKKEQLLAQIAHTNNAARKTVLEQQLETINEQLNNIEKSEERFEEAERVRRVPRDSQGRDGWTVYVSRTSQHPVEFASDVDRKIIRPGQKAFILRGKRWTVSAKTSGLKTRVKTKDHRIDINLIYQNGEPVKIEMETTP